MSRRTQLTLVLVAALLLLAATVLLAYSLAPQPVENLQSTLIPTMLTHPQVVP